jgi:hypothetical protein
MKTLLCLAILISTIEYPSDYIRIDHVGPCDKPIFSVEISNTSFPLSRFELDSVALSDLRMDDFTTKYVVKNRLYKDIRDTIYNLCQNQNDSVGYEYGNFRFTIFDNNNKLIECRINREQANILLPKLMNVIEERKGNSDLKSRLEYILARVDYNYY